MSVGLHQVGMEREGGRVYRVGWLWLLFGWLVFMIGMMCKLVLVRVSKKGT